MIGPGKGFDTDQYFVICSNVIGGCKGSTGPEQHQPGHRQGVRADVPVRHGGRHGAGAEAAGRPSGHRPSCWPSPAAPWAACRRWSGPSPTRRWWRPCIPIAVDARGTRPCRSPSTRWAAQAIMARPQLERRRLLPGRVPGQRPGRGPHDRAHHLPVRRVHAREVRPPPARARRPLGYDFTWTSRWRATCATRARCSRAASTPTPTCTSPRRSTTSISPAGTGVLVEAFRELPDDMRFLVIAFSSDWLYPPYQSKEIVRALKGNGLDCTYLEMQLVVRARRLPAGEQGSDPGGLALPRDHGPAAGGCSLA